MSFKVDIEVREKGRRQPQFTLDSDLNGEVTLKEFLDYTKSSLIIISDNVLREEQSRGFDKNPVVAVDNRVGKAIANVHPLGQIEFTSRSNMKDILLDTYKGIQGRSPILTGRYASSNYVFLNGTQVATDLASLESWLARNPEFKEKDIIRFVNIQPYARKLERLGIIRGNERNIGRRRTVKSSDKRKAAQGHRILAPNGTYFLTAKLIRSKYKRNSSVKFTFISGGSLGIKGNFKVGRRGKPGRPYLYPTIVIAVSESGTL